MSEVVFLTEEPRSLDCLRVLVQDDRGKWTIFCSGLCI